MSCGVSARGGCRTESFGSTARVLCARHFRPALGLKEEEVPGLLELARGAAVPAIAAADEPRWIGSRSTTSARASGARRSLLVSPCPAGPERKVGEQLCDALGRVVMHPMRRTEQALDAVQVG